MKDILITYNSSVKDTLKKLNITSKKVLLVVDKDNNYIGTITDGDIRRGLLKGYNLESSIKDLYSRETIFVNDANLENLKELFLKNKVDLIPVINNNSKIVRYYTWDDIFSGEVRAMKEYESIKIPVVIMAGGKGTRMAPFTDILPKPLIPINGKSMLENIIDNFKDYGVKDYYFTLNYKGKIIEAYFESIEKDYNLTNIWEEEFWGTAGCLHLLDDTISEESFIVSNCDILVDVNYSEVLKFHNKNNAYITVVSSIQHHKFPYGVIDFEEAGRITGMREKPEFSFPINTGVYILNKKCLDYIPKNKFFNMTDLIEVLINNEKGAFTYFVNEKDFIDIGQWDEYRSALSKIEGKL